MVSSKGQRQPRDKERGVKSPDYHETRRQACRAQTTTGQGERCVGPRLPWDRERGVKGPDYHRTGREACRAQFGGHCGSSLQTDRRLQPKGPTEARENSESASKDAYQAWDTGRMAELRSKMAKGVNLRRKQSKRRLVRGMVSLSEQLQNKTDKLFHINSRATRAPQ